MIERATYDLLRIALRLAVQLWPLWLFWFVWSGFDAWWLDYLLLSFPDRTTPGFIFAYRAWPTAALVGPILLMGAAIAAYKPRGTAARYDRQLDRIIVELANGCTFAFPPRLAQGLEKATEDQLAQVQLLGAGSGLHWEALDADLSIPDLLAGLFGTKAFMARHAGRATSPAKAAAARANGARGGRPLKAAGA